MLDSQRVALRSDAMRSSFEKLDRDGDGYISVQDLAQVCVGLGGEGGVSPVWGGLIGPILNHKTREQGFDEASLLFGVPDTA